MEIRNSDLRYTEMDDAEFLDYFAWLEEIFKDFLVSSDYPEDIDYFVSRRDLADIFLRVDKRKAYYYCFHGMEIHEKKEVALFAYWILKFQPFTVIDNRYIDKKKENGINDAFAIYMICSILCYTGISFESVVKKNFYNKLLYSFRFRDFSIDSLMMLVESLSAETFNIEYDEVV